MRVLCSVVKRKIFLFHLHIAKLRADVRAQNTHFQYAHVIGQIGDIFLIHRIAHAQIAVARHTHGIAVKAHEKFTEIKLALVTLVGLIDGFFEGGLTALCTNCKRCARTGDRLHAERRERCQKIEIVGTVMGKKIRQMVLLFLLGRQRCSICVKRADEGSLNSLGHLACKVSLGKRNLCAKLVKLLARLIVQLGEDGKIGLRISRKIGKVVLRAICVGEKVAIHAHGIDLHIELLAELKPKLVVVCKVI